jgi:hypothetical protein
MHYVYYTKLVPIHCMLIKILLLVKINYDLIFSFFIVFYFNLALHCAATRGHASCIRMLVELYECPLESLYKMIEEY